MTEKVEVYSPGGTSYIRSEAILSLEQAKKREAGKIKRNQLKRVEILNGYVMTNNVDNWKEYNRENGFIAEK